MYVHVEAGTSPLILSVPHDGQVKVAQAAVRAGHTLRDLWTRPLADACRRRLGEEFGVSSTLVAMELHRSHLDVNREIHRDACALGFEVHYHAYHTALDQHIQRTLQTCGRALLIDVHGFTGPLELEPFDLVLGTAKGTSCDLSLALEVRRHLSQNFRAVFSPEPGVHASERLSGGWTTRRMAHSWHPHGLQTMQMEFHRRWRTDYKEEMAGRHLALSLRNLLYEQG